MSRRLGLVVAATILGGAARAGERDPPYSYVKSVPGGQFEFVMIAPEAFADAELTHPDARRAAAARELRGKCRRSGLYRVGVTEPAWAVDWYAYDGEAVPAPDGVHLVRTHVQRPGDHALRFYANGRLVRSYNVGDLINDPAKIPGHDWFLDWKRRSQLNAANLRYTLTTSEYDEVVFDLRTGRVEHAPPGHAVWGGLNRLVAVGWGWLAFGVAALSILAMGLAWWRWGREPA